MSNSNELVRQTLASTITSILEGDITIEDVIDYDYNVSYNSYGDATDLTVDLIFTIGGPNVWARYTRSSDDIKVYVSWASEVEWEYLPVSQGKGFEFINSTTTYTDAIQDRHNTGHIAS